ncbi:MAG: RNA 2',3'-cyclic phosphodiesterase [Ignavibacteria bacterium]|nr:RNA 2',3'-cyclic phosphodiesterase [Ignavibacteria bacterium]
MKHRLFIAIDFPDEVKQSVYQNVKKMIKGSDLRISKPENLHITIKFLGDVEETKILEIISSLDFLKSIRGETVNFSRYGFFYRNRVPAVFWLKCEVGENVISTVKKLETVCEQIGFKKVDREFVPHLTLCRIKREPDPAIVQKILNEPAINLATTISNITLFSSVLTEKGAIYTVLHNYQELK